MKVLLVHHSIIPDGFVPMGLSVLSAVLKKQGHKVEMFDTFHYHHNERIKHLSPLFKKVKEYNPKKDVFKAYQNKLKTFKPGLVGFTATTNEMHMVKKLMKLVDSYIILGGAYPTTVPEEAIKIKEVNAICIGEGEEAISELVIFLENHIQPTHIKNLWIKDGKDIEKNQLRPLININELPYMDYDIVKKEMLVKPFEGKDYISGQIEMCYDEQTEILTKEGWKLFKDLSYKDEVITLNHNNNNITYQKPKNIIIRKYSGEMIHFKTRQLDVLVTPNHRMYVRKNHQKNFKIIQAKDLLNKYRFEMKKDGIWKGKNQKYFILPSLAYTSGNKYKAYKKIKKLVFKMNDFLEFLGYFISEGYIQKKKTNNYNVVICQNEGTDKYRIIERCLKRCGFHISYGKNKLVINSKQLFCYLEEHIGKGAQNKCIPSFVKELPPNKIKIILEALLLGDGCKCKSGKTIRKFYISTSNKLMDDIQELLLKVGLCGNIRKTKKYNRFISNRIIKKENNSDCYSIEFNNDSKYDSATPTFFPLQGHVKTKNYNGNVYCCEVPLYGLIYVRRNGYACWCGNTRGCPYQCAYCINSYLHGLYKGLGPFFRRKNPKRMIEEMLFLKNRYNLEFIRFGDENFLGQPTASLKEFAELYNKHINLPFVVATRPETINEEKLDILKTMPIKQVSLGIEHGNEKFRQKVLNRSCSNISIINAFKLLRKYKIKSGAYLMIGFPTETEKLIREGFDLVLKINPDIVAVYFFRPYDNTPLMDLCKKHDLLKKGNANYFEDSIVKGISNRKLKKLRDDFYEEFKNREH